MLTDVRAGGTPAGLQYVSGFHGLSATGRWCMRVGKRWSKCGLVGCEGEASVLIARVVNSADKDYRPDQQRAVSKNNSTLASLPSLPTTPNSLILDFGVLHFTLNELFSVYIALHAWYFNLPSFVVFLCDEMLHR